MIEPATGDSSTSIPRHLESDVGRLLLILHQFSAPVTEEMQAEDHHPRHPVVLHFTPEYRLHKLDFYLRYPTYLAHAILKRHQQRQIQASPEEVKRTVREIFEKEEPEWWTNPFKKFLRGAYERLDDVESYWRSRKLVFSSTKKRGDAPAQKHYYMTELGVEVCQQLITHVDHARWYQARLVLIERFLGDLTPTELKNLQYSQGNYQGTPLNEDIPDLSTEDVHYLFLDVFGEDLRDEPTE